MACSIEDIPIFRSFFVDEDTILVDIEPIPGFIVHVTELFTIDVNFDDVVFCNGSNPYPSDLRVPRTIPLILVTVPGLKTYTQTVVQSSFLVVTAASMMVNHADVGSSFQTMVSIGMLSCASPTTRSTVGNFRALGPLPVEGKATLG